MRYIDFDIPFFNMNDSKNDRFKKFLITFIKIEMKKNVCK